MKDVALQKLTELAEVAGVLSCGLCFADRTVEGRGTVADLSADDLKLIWLTAAETFKVLNMHRFPPIELKWFFEDRIVFCVSDLKDNVLGVVVTKSIGEGGLTRVRGVFTSFRNGTENLAQ